jgi:hypothetical protein
MAGRNSDDDLAYGQYHGQGGEESDRGFLGDAFNRFAGRRPQQQVSLPDFHQQTWRRSHGHDVSFALPFIFPLTIL